MDKIQKVLNKLDELDISYEIIRHKAVYTIEEMDELKELENYEIVKNLFLRDDKGKEHYLVVLMKDKRADLRNLRAQIESRHLSFASEKRLEKYLGLETGAVSPLGIINDSEAHVKVIFDKDLVGKENIGVHPNDNTATVILSFDDLVKVIEDNGNKVMYVDL
ncbi:MAG: prolyl-tRNA synthetase associated domain-containing protein [Clostridiaceae bacterium]|nr:prolyl-tRNA synthetase associated domain-containing protein [Clostridiaceae bacterium]